MKTEGTVDKPITPVKPIIRTVGEVSLEQRLTTAMHRSIQTLVKIMDEGAGGPQLQAAMYLLEMGEKRGIPLTDTPDSDTPSEGSPSSGPAPSAVPVLRSHSMARSRIKEGGSNHE